MSRTAIIENPATQQRTLVVASPELYERAPSGRLVSVGHTRSIGAAFVTELVENGVFAGVSLTTFYRESPAFAMLVGLVFIGLVNAAAMTMSLQCCGERGLVWRIRATYPLQAAENPDRARYSYVLRSFRFDYGLTDTFGQGLLRVGLTALAPGFDHSFNDAFATTGGWVTRNVVGRGVTAIVNLGVYGYHTPKDDQIAGLFLAFDDHGNLLTASVSVQTFSKYGERGPVNMTTGEFHASTHANTDYAHWYGILFNGHNRISQRFDAIAHATRVRAASDSIARTFSRALSRSNVGADRGAGGNDESQEFKRDDDRL
jgi:hypothetical protein